MPLTIQYCSDLHLEFDRNRKWLDKHPLQVAGDILLLGGDIMPLAAIEQHSSFLNHVAARYKAVYWLPGNHEYYHSHIHHYPHTLHQSVRDNVFLVNNTTVRIDNTDLICSTLWSHISPTHEVAIHRAMADFRLIEGQHGRLTVAEYNQLHRQALQYIKQAISDSTARHKIVLTHHVPTFMHYPPQYKGDALNEGFATELHQLIEDSGADYWLYGHTHYNTPHFTIGNTHLVTNQLGYVQYGENKHFDNAKTIILA